MHQHTLFVSGVFLFILAIVSVTVFHPQEKMVGKASVIVPPQAIPPASLPPAGQGTVYVYGSMLVASKSNGKVTYHLQDSLGSNRYTVNERGIIQSKATQYPYGKTLTQESFAGNGQKYLFTGKEKDDALYYYGARYYDPRVGRFISVDPLTATQALYDYAGGNPVNNIDPDGRKSYRSLSYQLVANIVPALRIAAIGTLSYNLAKGRVKEPQTIIAGAITFHGLMEGFPYLLPSSEKEIQRIGLTASTDRLDPSFVRIFSDEMRKAGGERSRKDADSLDRLSREGRVFGTGLLVDNKYLDVPFLAGVNNLESIFPSQYNNAGVYYPGYDTIVIGLPEGKNIGSPLDYILPIAAHEAHHSTQGGLRRFLGSLLGFRSDSGYWSIFNPIEEVSRKEADIFRRDAEIPEVQKEFRYLDAPMGSDKESLG